MACKTCSHAHGWHATGDAYCLYEKCRCFEYVGECRCLKSLSQEAGNVQSQ